MHSDPALQPYGTHSNLLGPLQEHVSEQSLSVLVNPKVKNKIENRVYVKSYSVLFLKNKK